MNDIVLLEAPQSSYVVRSRPAILSCKALNAKRLRFKCNSRWVSLSVQSAALYLLNYVSWTTPAMKSNKEWIPQRNCRTFGQRWRSPDKKWRRTFWTSVTSPASAMRQERRKYRRCGRTRLAYASHVSQQNASSI